MGANDFLFIGDTQRPFEAENLLPWLAHLKRHYAIPDDNCYHVGDEDDLNWAGRYAKDPNSKFSPHTELMRIRELNREWEAVFPKLKLCTSNHGDRFLARALENGIPEILLRQYKEATEAPDGWHWAKYWEIHSTRRIIVEHGDAYGGQTPHIQAALHNGCCTVIGHHHTIGGVEEIRTKGQSIWGASTSCLIDFKSINECSDAYKYACKFKRLPIRGLVVAFDGGKSAMRIPFD